MWEVQLFSSYMDLFHDIYVDDNQVILSKCLFKCEVSIEEQKAVCTQKLCPYFFRIRKLLVFPTTQHYLLDSLNFISKKVAIMIPTSCCFCLSNHISYNNLHRQVSSPSLAELHNFCINKSDISLCTSFIDYRQELH